MSAMDAKIRQLHSAHELAPNVLQLNEFIADGGTMKWEARTCKKKSGGKEMGIGFYDSKGVRLGAPGADLTFDFGPAPVSGIYAPSTSDHKGNPARASAWSLNVKIDLSGADDDAPIGSTAHVLSKFVELFEADLPVEAHKLKCLYNAELVPDSQYFTYARKSADEFASWYNIIAATGNAPGTPIKVSEASGEKALNARLKVVGSTFYKGKVAQTELADFKSGPTYDYCMSCDGGAESPEFQHFGQNMLTDVVRLPWVRYRSKYGKTNVPAGKFRDAVKDISRGSSIFFQGRFNSIINPNKTTKDPIFRLEPSGITVIKAVPYSSGGGMRDGAVDYGALMDGGDADAINDEMLADAADKADEEEYAPGDAHVDEAGTTADAQPAGDEAAGEDKEDGASAETTAGSPAKRKRPDEADVPKKAGSGAPSASSVPEGKKPKKSGTSASKAKARK
jgi:hypothetical protein